MCDYCNIEKFDEHWNDAFLIRTIVEGDYTELNIFYDKVNKSFSIDACGEGHASDDMNYCFKCGRKLT